MEDQIIKVSAHSGASAVAGAIAALIREKGEAKIQVVGAGALNQAVKAVILGLGALGLANMWFAVFGDVGVLILAILNAMRCLHKVE